MIIPRQPGWTWESTDLQLQGGVVSNMSKGWKGMPAMIIILGPNLIRFLDGMAAELVAHGRQ